MPSVNSRSMPKVWPSSTFTTPSLPTFSMASAITSPISSSPAEIVALGDVERDALLAVLVEAALADRDDPALLRLLLRRVGEDDPARGDLLLLDRPHDQPIAQ